MVVEMAAVVAAAPVQARVAMAAMAPLLLPGRAEHAPTRVAAAAAAAAALQAQALMAALVMSMVAAAPVAPLMVEAPAAPAAPQPQAVY
jgi:hypothetical protein